MIIGIDFDNTIVDYTPLFRDVALERNWIGEEFPCSKKSIRDRIRRLPDGEMRWRDVQALVYGPRILEASPFAGVAEFFRRAGEAGHEIHIVSHKTEFAANDRDKSCNLRDAAADWLKKNGFAGDSTGQTPVRVHFADTGHEKATRIAELGCAVFIDDLVKTFEEEAFPKDAVKYLFAPGGEDYPDFSGTVVRTWDEIRQAILGSGNAA
jgi:hypothetical protein